MLADPGLQQIGKRLRDLRTRQGLTQQALADRLGNVRRQEISQMENGRFFGSVRKLMGVLGALGVRLCIEPDRYLSFGEKAGVRRGEALLPIFHPLHWPVM